MNHTRGRHPYLSLLSIAALLAAAGTARANFSELLRRAPHDANTIIMIDVERLLMSPIAMKEKWLDKIHAPGAASLQLPTNSKRYMLVSKLNFVGDFENIWDVGLIETTGPVALPYLAKAEGGYLDKVEGFEVAYSPRNAFYVSLKPDIVGVSFPANRQDLGRWLRTVQKRNEPQVSEYLQSVVLAGHGKEQIVAGFDLADLLTSRQVRDRLHTAESLAGKELDMDAITKALTSMRGVMFSAEASDRISGAMRIDFAESPTPLKEIAKPLIMEVLENRGLLLDDAIKDYRQASMAGNQGYGYGGFYGGGTNLSLGTSVMRKQEAAVLQSNVMAVFTMLQEKTAEVRKAMTLKYQVEF
jgi:hypothetical protein